MRTSALGAFLQLTDTIYFVTASKLEAGNVTALCLTHPETGSRFLLTRQ